MAGTSQRAAGIQNRIVLRARHAAGFILLAFLIAQGPQPACAQAVKGDVSVTTTGGYARIVLQFAEEVESEVKVAGGIVIVSFKRPVNIPIENVVGGATGYVGGARRDPDGTGLRIALTRKVTVNSMAAGEKLFIDLLPETWSGVAPGLPQDVIEDLARRAREAEKALRQQRQVGQKQKKPAARIRAATQPTFTRYTFELPEVVPVTSDRVKDVLTITFAAPLTLDLGDVKANLPPMVKSIEAESGSDSIAVRFALNGKVDVRSFREDNNYVVDVGASDAKDVTIDLNSKISDTPGKDGVLSNPLAGTDAPQTVPPKGQGAAAKPQAPAAAKPEPQAPPPAKPVTEAPKAAPAPVAAAKPEPQIPPAAKPVADAPKPASPPPARTEISFPPPQDFGSEPAPDKANASASAIKTQAPVIPAAAAVQAEPAKAEPAKAEPAGAEPAKAEPAKVSPVKSEPEKPAVSGDNAPRDPNAVAVTLGRQGENLTLGFGFAKPVPAAIFRRADTLWLIFDTDVAFDLSALNGDTSHTIRSALLVPTPKGQIVRVLLERPRLVSAATDGPAWNVTVGDAVLEPTKPLGIARNVIGNSRASVTIPFDSPGSLHRIDDPDIGDKLYVVTAPGPARGLLKAQDFVEFRALASTQGLVIQPIADDLIAELAVDKITIGRPGGLTLSGALADSGKNAAAYRPLVFDAQLWGFDRQSNFNERQYKLIAAAADAAEARRAPPRLELARFYFARDMFAEAKAVLDVSLADDRPTVDDPTALVLHAIANIMLNRPDEALKDLADPLIGNQHDAPLWRAFAYARQGRWAEARQGFKNVEAAIATLPIEFQRLAIKEALRAAIEVRDFAGADHELNEFQTIGMPKQMEPAILVLTGRLAQGLGRNEDALKNFRNAADSENRPAAAEGRLREIALRYGLGDFKRSDVIVELETLTTLWRGDETEIEALQLLARLYTEENRYRDAFYVMRTALTAHPNSELTRRIHDEAAETFDSLFLAGKGDALPAFDALSLFYDFRELTPIGRRGDEMIRRLADRLVSVDLLFQASELLQHQVDHRLQGIARSQVATRLAVIYLMDRRPDKAQAVLKATQVAGMSNDLRQLRLLLEARALSDLGRNELALEVIASIDRREAIRLRSDILWVAKRYQDAAEQLELLHGERWRDFEPLNEVERADILRAAMGYALSGDSIGVGRLREKYASKMADGADRRAFDIATGPIGTNSAEFREISKKVAATDTLDNFLREMRATYPEIGALSASDLARPPAAAPVPARAAKSDPVAKAEPSTTGSIGKLRAAAR